MAAQISNIVPLASNTTTRSQSTADPARAAGVDERAIAQYLDLLFGPHDWPEGTGIGLRGLGEKGTPAEGRFQENIFVPADTPEIMAAAVIKTVRRWNEHGHGAFIIPKIVRPEVDDRARYHFPDKSIIAATALPLDFDTGDTLAKLMAARADLGEPSLVVESGGRTPEGKPKLHAYWSFTEAVDDMARVSAMCNAAALRYGADASFKRIAQVIRIPGSIHGKGGASAPVRIVHQGGGPYEFEDLADRVGPPPVEPGVGVGLRFSPASGNMAGGAVARALTEDIHEGGEDRTRWGEFSRVAGLFIALVREGSIPSAEDAREMTLGWMHAKMKPAWPEDRFNKEFEALLAKDQREKGPLAPAGVSRPGAAIGTAKAATPLDVAQFRLDVLAAGDPPVRKWLVRNCFPLGIAALLFGAGGLGKSFAALELCIAVGSRSKEGGEFADTACFLGGVPKEAAGAAVFLTLEDDRDEVHRRVQAVDPENRRAGKPIFVLTVLDIPGFDPTLVEQRGREVVMTEFAKNGLRALLAKISENAGVPVRLLALDPAGDFISASEDEASGPKLLMRELREIAREHGCTILLLGHTAKGVTNAEAIVERGMRGSTAFVANSRAAVGLWAPSEPEAMVFLRRIGEAPTPAAIARVVFGRFVKANHPGAPAGTLKFLRDAKSGRLINFTARDRAESADEAEVAMDKLVAAVKEASELNQPFQSAGGAHGLHKRRADLPAPLNTWGATRLEKLAANALSQGLLVKSRGASSSAAVWLDVPDGPWARGEGMEIAHGSLANLREAKARADRALMGGKA